MIDSSTIRLLKLLWQTPEGVNAWFGNTGGGNLAVEITGDGWTLMATDVEGSLSPNHIDNDRGRTGWCVGRDRRHSNGEWQVDEDPLYLSDDLKDVQAVARVMVQHAFHPDLEG